MEWNGMEIKKKKKKKNKIKKKKKKKNNLMMKKKKKKKKKKLHQQPDRQLHIPRLDSSFRGESRSMKDTVLMIPNDGASPLEYEGTIPKFGQVQKFSLADRRLDGICLFWAQ